MHRDASWIAARPRLLGALFACLGATLLPSCGAEDAAETVEQERVAFLLVERPERMRVLSQPEEQPVDFGMLLPRPSSTRDAGPLPALRMAPSSSVEFRLPELPAGARLAFALGIDQGGYELVGRNMVHFRAELDGREVVSESLVASRRLPKAEQTWARVEVPVDGAGTLRLSAEFEGPGEPPRVGFGLLEVRVPFRIQRQRASEEEPNVVLILIDTLRADRLGAYGNERGLTPNLDRLAERGTLFERCFAPSSWTWPSTASLFTGLAPPAHGVESEQACFLSYDLITLAEVFRDDGLRTAAFSTNKLIGPTKNFDQGFEDFDLRPWVHTREIRDDVEGWLRDNADERFFLYLHLTDPHTPYAPEEDLRERFAGPAPEGWTAEAAWDEIKRKLRSEEYDPDSIAAFADYDRALYDGEVAAVDRQLGRIFELLGELELDGNTIVCVTSDHGEEFHEHGMYHHTKQLYDEVLHVPLLMAGPGIESGRRVPHGVALLDVGSTLLSAAGVGSAAPPEERLGGADLLRDPARTLPLFFSTAVGWWFDESAEELVMKESPLFGLTDGAEHFVWGPPPAADEAPNEAPNGMEVEPGVERTRLFDVARDPRQLEDLSAERPESVERHRSTLQEWIEDSLLLRPNTFGGDADVLGMLEELGYVGED